MTDKPTKPRTHDNIERFFELFDGLGRALPYYFVFINLGVVVLAGWYGGKMIGIAFIFLLFSYSLGDKLTKPNLTNIDPTSKDNVFFWYRLVTLVWPFVQIIAIFFMLYACINFDHSRFERVSLMILTGATSAISGTVIAHELIHQSNRIEKLFGDILLGSVLYGHFRTEHLLVHHRYVGTPKDAVTARYNESLYRFLLRAIPKSFISAFRTEKNLLNRKNRPVWHVSNPFYQYFAWGGLFIFVAYIIGGERGIMLFFIHAVTAICTLETTNYIEHYGLCRKYLGDGKYEHVQPRHSWNANHRFTNYLLINLQRHSDHHYKPARRYPLLQSYDETEAPQLPYGYLVMSMIAWTPLLWRKVMNPKVRRWRSMYYPEITDWKKYNNGQTPWPK